MNARDPLKAQTRRKPLTNAAGEVRELTHEDLQRFRPASEVLSPALRRKLGVRGPQRAPTKVHLTLRLSHETLERFKASGPGWQTRIDTVLTKWLRRHKPEEIEV